MSTEPSDYAHLWFCETCRERLDDEGCLSVNSSRARDGKRAKWTTHCAECKPRRPVDFSVSISAVRTRVGMLATTARLLSAPWLRRTDWTVLLEVAARDAQAYPGDPGRRLWVPVVGADDDAAPADALDLSDQGDYARLSGALAQAGGRRHLEAV